MAARANRAIVTAAVLACAAVGLAAVLTTRAPSDNGRRREVRLVVRNMAFYFEGQDEPNPTIALRAGEQITITVRNEEPGMRHDFAVPTWKVATRMLEERGETDTLTFRVPLERGSYAYRCTPHAQMMNGSLRVE